MTNWQLKQRIHELVSLVSVDRPNWGEVQELARLAQEAAAKLPADPLAVAKP